MEIEELNSKSARVARLESELRSLREQIRSILPAEP